MSFRSKNKEEESPSKSTKDKSVKIKVKTQEEMDREILSWTNKNMRYVFKRMFEVSIDFPINAWPNYEEY